MPRDLAREERVLLADPVLDVGVAHPARHRPAAHPLDELGHGMRGPHVVDDRGARLALQHQLCDQRGDEVAGYELARVIDEEAAIPVAVERDAEVGPGLAHAVDDELAALGQQRVRLVVREAAVRLEVTALDDDRQAIEDRRDHVAAHAVGGVDDHVQRRDRGRVDDREAAVGELAEDLALAALAGPRRACGTRPSARGRARGRGPSRHPRAARRGAPS